MLDKIAKLRAQFSHFEIDAYVIPSNDEFNNEYLPEHLQRLRWLTDFSGSNGTLIVTQKDLLFFTDGRYLLQASQELDKEYEIFDMHATTSCSAIPRVLQASQVLGFDPMLHSITNFEYYQKLALENRFATKAIERNLVDSIWHERPIFIPQPVINLEMKYAGISTQEKVAMILSKWPTSVDYLLFTGLDSICWLLNLRGSDIQYNPFFLAYMLIKKSGEIELFTESSITIDMPNLSIHPLKKIKEMYADMMRNNVKVQLDRHHTPVFFYQPQAENNIVFGDNPILLAKACKNKIELDGMKEAHLLDAIAVCKFMYWLENHIDSGVSEIQAADKLLEFRQRSDLFITPSFATISAFAEHGAIIHYHPSKLTDKILDRNNLYLLDSGGHYWCGTTDVTRTLCFGTPTIEQRRMFTLVLKGFIRLFQSVFPIGTSGGQLESLARYDLWRHGLDYAHGTGHGVGHCLSVHEGPQAISKRNNIALQPAMILSNEPGYYKNGEYGIRIENLMYVQNAPFNNFLCFETLTLIPIAHNLIEQSILTTAEIEWLDHYHETIKEKLKEALSVDELRYVLRKSSA